jgi:hypothetical protein
MTVHRSDGRKGQEIQKQEVSDKGQLRHPAVRPSDRSLSSLTVVDEEPFLRRFISGKLPCGIFQQLCRAWGLEEDSIRELKTSRMADELKQKLSAILSPEVLPIQELIHAWISDTFHYSEPDDEQVIPEARRLTRLIHAATVQMSTPLSHPLKGWVALTFARHAEVLTLSDALQLMRMAIRADFPRDLVFEVVAEALACSLNFQLYEEIEHPQHVDPALRSVIQASLAHYLASVHAQTENLPDCVDARRVRDAQLLAGMNAPRKRAPIAISQEAEAAADVLARASLLSRCPERVALVRLALYDRAIETLSRGEEAHEARLRSKMAAIDVTEAGPGTSGGGSGALPANGSSGTSGNPAPGSMLKPAHAFPITLSTIPSAISLFSAQLATGRRFLS